MTAFLIALGVFASSVMFGIVHGYDRKERLEDLRRREVDARAVAYGALVISFASTLALLVWRYLP